MGSWERSGPQTDTVNTCAAKYLYWSIFKKSGHLGFGVLIYFWSMTLPQGTLFWLIKVWNRFYLY
jgi:hypothetical protein